MRIFQVARRARPEPIRPYVLLTARNLIIDRLRQKRIVSIETMADTDWLSVLDESPTPEQRLIARQEVSRVQDALNSLPERCREILVLRKVQGVSQREIARKLGIKEQTVETQVVRGMRVINQVDAGKVRSATVTSRMIKRFSAVGA